MRKPDIRTVQQLCNQLKKVSDLKIDEGLHLRQLVKSIEHHRTKFKDLEDMIDYVKRNLYN